MTEWRVEVVKIGKVGKHPNADTLSITQIHGGYPVIFRTGDYNEGDKAIYVPVDSTVPDTPQFAFLGGKRRIRAKKIRGIFSQGMLIPSFPDMEPGQIVHDAVNITKWEPPEETIHHARGQVEKGPEDWQFVKYTDIEGLRRFKDIFVAGEEVVITEKVHGQNGRMCWDGTRLWCGSRNEIKKEDEAVNWWHVAKKLNLAERFAKFPKVIFYGEIYGTGIQKLKYGKPDKNFVIFDTFDVSRGRWNDWDKTVELAKAVDLPIVNVLYRGPWKSFEEHAPLAEGNSTMEGADHVREGFVVKPVVERWDELIGRVIAKLVGEGYLLEK